MCSDVQYSNSNKTNNHLLPQNTERHKTTTYEVESTGHGWGPPQKCGGVKPVDGIPNPSPLDNGIYNRNTYINKR